MERLHGGVYPFAERVEGQIGLSRRLRFAKFLGQRVREYPVADRSVVIFICVAALQTGREDYRHVRPATFPWRLAILFCGLFFAQAHRCTELLCAAIAPHVFLTDVAAATEIGVKVPQVALFPHLFRFVPAQHSVPDVVRRSDGANLPRAIPGQTAGMAAIEDGEKLRAVRKRAVVAQKIVVSNGAVLCPMKIVRHETFIDMIDSFRRVVVGQLCAMPAIKKDALVAIGRRVQ